jgi:hypothetical protein
MPTLKAMQCIALLLVQSVCCCNPSVKLQVELMMKFDHPNLIKAYHYVTWGAAGVSVRLTRVRSAMQLLCLSGMSGTLL